MSNTRSVRSITDAEKLAIAEVAANTPEGILALAYIDGLQEENLELRKQLDEEQAVVQAFRVEHTKVRQLAIDTEKQVKVAEQQTKAAEQQVMVLEQQFAIAQQQVKDAEAARDRHESQFQIIRQRLESSLGEQRLMAERAGRLASELAAVQETRRRRWI
ncbi:hypothetical protein AMS68_003832 [Peltaster fructicola]|uniref:Uncharacterized protein n=1 Tax=Peltaster fructicola TaxID=286661 RepID=A0A6H0XUI4_9PEZI|nr:hypothetical protein AMS68_003832 [Peltaster fructicola]